MSSADSQAFEMSLRDQLIAAQNNHAPPQPHQQPLSHPPPADSYATHQSPQHHHDQVMAIQSYGMPQQSAELGHAAPTANSGTGKKGRAQRELSNTKRAAQNRAAQRAFRLRKEQHIHKLEDDLKRHLVMEENHKTLQHELYTLREYITDLQTRMTDKGISFPPTPARLPLRSVGEQSPDNHSPLQDQQQDQAHTYHHMPVHSPEHDHQTHYPDASPPQAVSAAPTAYPPPSLEPSHDRHPQQHDRRTDPHPAQHDTANDPLPPGAISRLQAAAAQADDINPSHASPPHQDHQQQHTHPEDAQYVRASEYPAHKRPRLDLSPSHQPYSGDKPNA